MPQYHVILREEGSQCWLNVDRFAPEGEDICFYLFGEVWERYPKKKIKAIFEVILVQPAIYEEKAIAF